MNAQTSTNGHAPGHHSAAVQTELQISDENPFEHEYFARLPGVTVLSDGVVSVPVTEDPYVDYLLKELNRQLGEVNEEISDLLADRPGMVNFPERAYDDLLERKADLEHEIEALEKII